MQITNKQFALIVIIILGILQLVAYSIGFDGQFTVMVTGLITYLFGIVTGKEIQKRTK